MPLEKSMSGTNNPHHYKKTVIIMGVIFVFSAVFNPAKWFGG